MRKRSWSKTLPVLLMILEDKDATKNRRNLAITVLRDMADAADEHDKRII